MNEDFRSFVGCDGNVLARCTSNLHVDSVDPRIHREYNFLRRTCSLFDRFLSFHRLLNVGLSGYKKIGARTRASVQEILPSLSEADAILDFCLPISDHVTSKLKTSISTSPRQFQFDHGNFNLVTAISTSLTAISIWSRQFQLQSRQFQFGHGYFNFAHGNFNLTTAISTSLTAISIWSRQFQFDHGNFNFTHGNLNFLPGNIFHPF